MQYLHVCVVMSVSCAGEGSKVVQSVLGRRVQIGKNCDIVGCYIQDDVRIEVRTHTHTHTHTHVWTRNAGSYPHSDSGTGARLPLSRGSCVCVCVCVCVARRTVL